MARALPTRSALAAYVVDADGNFDWAAAEQEVHAFVNELEGGVVYLRYAVRA